VEEYRQRKRSLEQAIQSRKEAYEKFFLGEADPGANDEEPFLWIEAKYLKQWITGEKIKTDSKETAKAGAASSSSSVG